MAAAAAACRRALMLSGYNSRTVAGLASGLRAGGGGGMARGSGACSSSPIHGPEFYYGCSGHLRHVSQLLLKSNAKRAFLVDTLALVRRLEAQGIPSKQAEAITSAITEVLNDSLENVAHSFVSQGELQKFEPAGSQSELELGSEPAVTGPRTSSGSANIGEEIEKEHHFSMLQRETDKLKSDIERLRSELSYEVDKVTAGQRLDLNLERGRTRDELAKQNSETSELTNKLDREIHALKAQLEAAKYEVIKYCVGTLVSLTAVGLAVVRILL